MGKNTTWEGSCRNSRQVTGQEGCECLKVTYIFEAAFHNDLFSNLENCGELPAAEGLRTIETTEKT